VPSLQELITTYATTLGYVVMLLVVFGILFSLVYHDVALGKLRRQLDQVDQLKAMLEAMVTGHNVGLGRLDRIEQQAYYHEHIKKEVPKPDCSNCNRPYAPTHLERVDGKAWCSPDDFLASFGETMPSEEQEEKLIYKPKL